MIPTRSLYLHRHPSMEYFTLTAQKLRKNLKKLVNKLTPGVNGNRLTSLISRTPRPDLPMSARPPWPGELELDASHPPFGSPTLSASAALPASELPLIFWPE